MLSTETTPLERLVLFMVCLSVAGSAVAAVHYYAVDLPQQVMQAPENSAQICIPVIGTTNMLTLNARGEWLCTALYEEAGQFHYLCCPRDPA